MKTVSVLWMIFMHWRQLQPVLEKIMDAAGSDKVQVALQAIGEFFTKTVPPAPTADSIGNISVTPERERRWRLGRVIDRLRVAGTMTESEVRMACTAHKITPCEMEGQQWT